MSAVPAWRSIRQQVLDDARYSTGEAHLESSEVPRWIAETGDHDTVGALSEALSDIEDTGKLCALLDLLCEKGEDLAAAKMIDLLEMLRTALTEYCVRQAQKLVDEDWQ